MKKLIFAVLVYLSVEVIQGLNLPGPLVYVVTPSPRPKTEGKPRSVPFYYHNWMRRMDTPQNETTSTTTTSTTPKIMTPDLIFAEFDADNTMRKSIRKLLEKEQIAKVTTTTAKPIYVPEQMPESFYHDIQNNGKEEATAADMEDYYAMHNNMYKSESEAPVYLPFTTSTTTTTPAPMHVENIWHIIDNEKHDQQQYTGNWDEITPNKLENQNETSKTPHIDDKDKQDDGQLDDNFALPGLSTNPGNGAENESRAIRTESDFRFPYVNLKTFQLKKPLLNSLGNSRKGSNMFTSLDDFKDTNHPVRGEAQDVVPSRQQIDRYNPAQPYLPSEYGSKSKQTSISGSPVPNKAVANLVPPPPPRVTINDFPQPVSYDSFPPYPSQPDSAPLSQSRPVKPPSAVFQAPDSDSIPSDGADSGPSFDSGYRYKPPSPPKFVPTLPPPAVMNKPMTGYTYNKPVMDDSPPGMGYTYNKPVMEDTPPDMGYSYYKPSSVDKPPVSGYHYDKPTPSAPSEDHPPSPSYDHPPPSPSYGPDHAYHSHYHSHDNDYPELIYDSKHHGAGMDDAKGTGDMMKGSDMGMMPPPPPADMAPDTANGFPHDFPGDFKYHHDFDDHDYHHHHHHHTTTTTTTTTETPRVNRYSYYYLGKKLYYLPLYFSVYFVIYVGALIIKAVLRHKIVYPNSWRPNDQTASFFSKRSVDSWELSSDQIHEMTGTVTKALSSAAEKYMEKKAKLA